VLNGHTTGIEDWVTSKTQMIVAVEDAALIADPSPFLKQVAAAPPLGSKAPFKQARQGATVDAKVPLQIGKRGTTQVRLDRPVALLVNRQALRMNRSWI
jgi:hypothetical protein